MSHHTQRFSGPALIPWEWRRATQNTEGGVQRVCQGITPETIRHSCIVRHSKDCMGKTVRRKGLAGMVDTGVAAWVRVWMVWSKEMYGRGRTGDPWAW